ncbi:hypothetical protein BDV25DRAFT_163795 [Aspergillus avenaceus]|uniref:Uncharacterized protein n=1 Tax=Aspergillus avenaceus TaxID=36643 RepID=A0A5N6THJ5_ASPAV|nr:hypothetical protein BDV25DRAFT_163795 [Aspergillus avenaceus]
MERQSFESSFRLTCRILSWPFFSPASHFLSFTHSLIQTAIPCWFRGEAFCRSMVLIVSSGVREGEAGIKRGRWKRWGTGDLSGFGLINVGGCVIASL